MFSEYLSFCPQGGERGGGQILGQIWLMTPPPWWHIWWTKLELRTLPPSPLTPPPPTPHPPSDIAITAVRGTQSRFELPPCVSLYVGMYPSTCPSVCCMCVSVDVCVGGRYGWARMRMCYLPAAVGPEPGVEGDGHGGRAVVTPLKRVIKVLRLI